MSKYESALAEAASIIASHGFAQETAGTVEYGPGWHAWCVVSPTIVANLGEAALSVLVSVETDRQERNVIIREDSQGFVSVVASLRDMGAAERVWTRIVLPEIESAEDNEDEEAGA